MAKRKSSSTKPAREVAVPAPELPPVPTPVPLSAILGQDRALSNLDAALRSNRVHHAWILHGPAGVGKFTTALAFAAVLLDPSSRPNLSGRIEPDPDSPVQRLLAAGTHPDLHIITKELARFSDDPDVRKRMLTNIPREVVIQHLVGPVTLAATLRHAEPPRASKVFIIDEAELLDISPSNARTQNAILKTMEEPPPGTVIMLVTSNEERLLPTIRSRCQRIGFGLLDAASMRRWITARGLELDAKERDWLITFSEGSPGTLLLAAEGGFHAWDRHIGPMLAATEKGAFDLDLGPTMARLVDDWAKAWVDAHELASKEAANRAGARWVFRLVSAHFRARLRSSGDGAIQADAIELIREAERRLDANVQLAFVMDSLSAELATLFSTRSSPLLTG